MPQESWVQKLPTYHLFERVKIMNEQKILPPPSSTQLRVGLHNIPPQWPRVEVRENVRGEHNDSKVSRDHANESVADPSQNRTRGLQIVGREETAEQEKCVSVDDGGSKYGAVGTESYLQRKIYR